MKKTFKKTLSIVLAIISIFTLSLTAFAFSVDEAKAIALKDAGYTKAQVTALRGELDEGNFDVEFRADSKEYDYEINKDGEIIGFSIDFFEYYAPDRAKKISPDEAKAAAYKAVGVTPSSAVARYDGEDHEYEVSFSANGKRYEVSVSADNSSVLEYSWEIAAGAIGGSGSIGDRIKAFFQSIINFFKNLFKF